MGAKVKRTSVWKFALMGVLGWVSVFLMPQPAEAEYADVIINNLL